MIRKVDTFASLGDDFPIIANEVEINLCLYTIKDSFESHILQLRIRLVLQPSALAALRALMRFSHIPDRSIPSAERSRAYNRTTRLHAEGK